MGIETDITNRKILFPNRPSTANARRREPACAALVHEYDIAKIALVGLPWRVQSMRWLPLTGVEKVCCFTKTDEHHKQLVKCNSDRHGDSEALTMELQNDHSHRQEKSGVGNQSRWYP